MIQWLAIVSSALSLPIPLATEYASSLNGDTAPIGSILKYIPLFLFNNLFRILSFQMLGRIDNLIINMENSICFVIFVFCEPGVENLLYIVNSLL